MSGIAGILRRDGGPVPENWITLLEKSLMLGGGLTSRFEDSIPVEHGDLQIRLLSMSGSMMPEACVDGDLEGECCYARWNEDTLELELGRMGTGQKSLYWFDLGEAGNGLLFCSNPLPLLKIAHELELPNGNLSQGALEYLQYGFVAEGSKLLLPVCSMPLQNTLQCFPSMTSTLDCEFSTTVAEDVQTLVRVLGVPFADSDLLSTLQQYRYAKETGSDVVDGLVIAQEQGLFRRLFSSKQEEKQMVVQRNAARRIELDAIASYVDVALSISPEHKRIEPISFPLSTWLRSPQSSLGQLLGDTLNSPDAFFSFPIENKKGMQLLDAHRDGEADHAQELFALLTLELWRQQVLS